MLLRLPRIWFQTLNECKSTRSFVERQSCMYALNNYLGSSWLGPEAGKQPINPMGVHLDVRPLEHSSWSVLTSNTIMEMSASTAVSGWCRRLCSTVLRIAKSKRHHKEDKHLAAQFKCQDRTMAKEIPKSRIPNFPNFLGLVLGCIAENESI